MNEQKRKQNFTMFFSCFHSASARYVLLTFQLESIFLRKIPLYPFLCPPQDQVLQLWIPQYSGHFFPSAPQSLQLYIRVIFH